MRSQYILIHTSLIAMLPFSKHQGACIQMDQSDQSVAATPTSLWVMWGGPVENQEVFIYNKHHTFSVLFLLVLEY